MIEILVEYHKNQVPNCVLFLQPVADSMQDFVDGMNFLVL